MLKESSVFKDWDVFHECESRENFTLEKTYSSSFELRCVNSLPEKKPLHALIGTGEKRKIGIFCAFSKRFFISDFLYGNLLYNTEKESNHKKWIYAITNLSPTVFVTGSSDSCIICWEYNDRNEIKFIKKFESAKSKRIGFIWRIDDITFFSKGSNSRIFFWRLDQDLPLEGDRLTERNLSGNIIGYLDNIGIVVKKSDSTSNTMLYLWKIEITKELGGRWRYNKELLQKVRIDFGNFGEDFIRVPSYSVHHHWKLKNVLIIPITLHIKENQSRRSGLIYWDFCANTVNIELVNDNSQNYGSIEPTGLFFRNYMLYNDIKTTKNLKTDGYSVLWCLYDLSQQKLKNVWKFKGLRKQNPGVASHNSWFLSTLKNENKRTFLCLRENMMEIWELTDNSFQDEDFKERIMFLFSQIVLGEEERQLSIVLVDRYEIKIDMNDSLVCLKSLLCL